MTDKRQLMLIKVLAAPFRSIFEH